MQAQKISISLPPALYEFVGEYQVSHHRHSRSQVISDALLLLQKAYLRECYREANEELDDDFEITAGDGLDDEDEAW